MNHLPTCNPYCAVRHCICGRPALHGQSTCSACRTVTHNGVTR